MVKLKTKIKTVESLPTTEKKKISIIHILIFLLGTIILVFTSYLIYIKVTPYLNAVDINKISGKKTSITKCNTKDYIIISTDKTYSLNLTNNDCITKYYEGTITIKNNEIIFTKDIKGMIDNNYNIIINNNIFESDKNE